MSVVDTIKKSVLNQFSGTVSAVDIIISLVLAFAIGIYIVYIYKKTYTGVVYSKSFSLCVILLAMVTALIIRTISSNISLSLGMVGALSIVRFRTAIKEPVDTAFMFWAISAGIMTGAGLYLVAIVGSLLLGVLYFVSYLLGFKVQNRYLYIIKYDVKVHDKVVKKLASLPKYKLRSKSLFKDQVELTFEVDYKEKGKDDNFAVDIVDSFENMDGVTNVSLISYQNDFGD